MDLKSKKILIAGAGISGIGAAALLGKAGIAAAIYDGNEELDKEAVAAKLPEGMEISFELGEFKEELADKYGMDLNYMVGFLDGINESLKEPNPIEEMEADTVVKLPIDLESLYYHMVEAGADWLYELPEWDELLTPERRKELYREQKKSGTIVKERKVGRNEPCPCGSGKKYKYCCGRAK